MEDGGDPHIASSTAVNLDFEKQVQLGWHRKRRTRNRVTLMSGFFLGFILP